MISIRKIRTVYVKYVFTLNMFVAKIFEVLNFDTVLWKTIDESFSLEGEYYH